MASKKKGSRTGKAPKNAVGDVFKGGTCKSASKAMVVFRKISFTSVCPHHKTPMTGECSLAYIPNGLLAGIGRIPKLIKLLGEGESLQEELTEEIVEEMRRQIRPSGVAVVIRARHECMLGHGEKESENEVITSHFTGELRKPGRQNEFFQNLKL